MKTILLTGCALGLLLSAQAHATEAPLEGTLSKIASAISNSRRPTSRGRCSAPKSFLASV